MSDIARSCVHCGEPITLLLPPWQLRRRKFCSVLCRQTATRKLGQGSLLKSRYNVELRDRQMSVREACREAGMPYDRTLDWLHRDNSWLRIDLLTAAAMWLAVTLDEAIQLQGGTEEERRRERGNRLGELAIERYKNDAEFRDRFGRAGPAAWRGTSPSLEHRQKISAALKAYRQKPGAHRLGRKKATLHGPVEGIFRPQEINPPDTKARSSALD